MYSNQYVRNQYDLAFERIRLIDEINNHKKYDPSNPKLLEMERKLKEIDENFFKNLPEGITKENLWTYAVDGRDITYGRMSYDEGTNTTKCAEPGYIDAAESALGFVFNTIGCELTAQYILQLHSLCCQKVKGNGAMTTSTDTRAFSGAYYRTDKSTFTREGLKEMASFDFAKILIIGEYNTPLTSKNVEYFFQAIDTGKPGIVQGNTEDNVPEDESTDDFYNKKIEQFIQEYQQELSKALHDKEKIIIAIARLAKKIECLHPFGDGNLRTIRFMIYKLLKENNIELTNIHDPNIIDGHATYQIAIAIKAGCYSHDMDTEYESLCTKGKITIDIKPSTLLIKGGDLFLSSKEPTITLDDFRKAYNKQYKSEFFKNPFSKMLASLDENTVKSITDVETYAFEHPESRTAKVLQTLKYKR